IDSVKLAKVFKLAVSSNSKNFFTPILLHQLLNFKGITQEIVSLSLKASDKEKLMILSEGIL
ncbi:MAG: hypothetical protein E7E64_07275, partial [Clostridium celatum]|nr:hypothetical protein [Clostridium celatum]MDU4980978.1 hypothetical protein [Clostridium celatum]